MSYHNLYHAVDVMHATYLTLEGMGASGLLTELEQLALILSALCHDLDHPGLTNSFQVKGERQKGDALRAEYLQRIFCFVFVFLWWVT